MDKYAVMGAKKLLSLAKTKIRLAEEAGTIECRPNPLPLVKMFTGNEIKTIEEAKQYREELLKDADYLSPASIASTVISCMDLIEGVKYRYEPREYMSNIDLKGFLSIEDKAVRESIPLNILLMTKTAPEGLNIFVGSDPPKGVIFLSGVPTSLSTLLQYAYGSDYFSTGLRLKNMVSFIGHRTLIIDAVHYSLGVLGADSILY